MTKRDKRLTTNQLKFAEWLSLPEELRDPPTQNEFAVTIGVTPVTLSRWKREPELLDRAEEIALSYISGDIPDILHSAIKEAKGGSFQHQQMILKMRGLFSDRIDITSKGDSVKGYVVFSPDDWDHDEGYYDS